MTNYNTYRVQKYDYGEKENLKQYGQKTAPIYNFAQIPGPIALFFGADDRLGDPVDSAWLRSVIPSKSIIYQEDTYAFGHLTFIWGKNMTWFQNVIGLSNQYYALADLDALNESKPSFLSA